jgi:chemotaxis signal transduction protein
MVQKPKTDWRRLSGVWQNKSKILESDHGVHMLTTQTATTPTNATLSDVPAFNKHCVFRCSDSWFSVPAVSVREVVLAPELVRFPNCHRALAGLGHLRSEFVPVIALETLLNLQQRESRSADDCLLVLEGNCVWSLLISESAALQSLETIVSQESLAENTNNVVIGTAMFQDRIVRVLNPNGLLATAQHAFEQYWNEADGRINTMNS